MFFTCDSQHENLEALHTSKFNMRKTVISEYSNALHNKTVYVCEDRVGLCESCLLLLLTNIY